MHRKPSDDIKYKQNKQKTIKTIETKIPKIVNSILCPLQTILHKKCKWQIFLIHNRSLK